MARESILTDAEAEALLADPWVALLLRCASDQRVGELSNMADDIEGDESYWRCVALAWTSDDTPNTKFEKWYDLLFGDAARRSSEQIMCEAERAALAALPSRLTVYRGFAIEGGQRGFAWSLDREQSEFFARDFHRGGRVRFYGGRSDGISRLATMEIAKADVFAHMLERGEAEILIDPKHSKHATVEILADAEVGVN